MMSRKFILLAFLLAALLLGFGIGFLVVRKGVDSEIIQAPLVQPIVLQPDKEEGWCQDKISLVNFRLPEEIELTANCDGTGTLKPKPEIDDPLLWQGTITIYHDFSDYRHDLFSGGLGFLYDRVHRKWRYFGEDGEEDINQWIIGQTDQGADIFLFPTGDAGGQSRYYVIPLEGEPRSKTILLVFKTFTYYDPIDWGTRGDIGDEYDRWDKLSNIITKSFQLKTEGGNYPPSGNILYPVEP